ncbi:MAG: TnpV protein [Clostridia bacterium]|nr:TnpV protein [Clostridia bacterium]
MTGIDHILREKDKKVCHNVESMVDLRYLQEHRFNVYTQLLLSGKLYDDLNETEAEARRILEMTIPVTARAASITEKLKANDPMKWVGMMNAIKDQVEEIIWNELICA